VLRPGLVVGRGGLFGRMCASVRATPLVPLFYGGRQEIHALWVWDLCRAIESGLERNLTGIYRLAHPDAVPIRRLYEHIGGLVGHRCLFVPLPAAPVLLALRVGERLGVSLPITSDNVLGLKRLQAVDVRPDLARLGLAPRSFGAALELLRARKDEDVPGSGGETEPCDVG